MTKHPSSFILPRHIFLKRLFRNILFGWIIILTSLFIGMLGYHYLENLSWINSFENAAMILSGMGPVDGMQTYNGKLFAGCYALFSGILFLVVVATVFAPAIHWSFRKFHLLEEKK